MDYMKEMDISSRLVLYADDDTDDLFFVRDAFSAYPEIELKTFLDGGQILTYIERLKSSDKFPCLVILDINMPVVNGKEVLFRLREMEKFKNTPIIIFTTSSYSFDQEFAGKYDARFIVKPLHLDHMQGVIEEFLKYCSINENSKAE
jgi:CheY-like chemotaxis protein